MMADGDSSIPVLRHNYEAVNSHIEGLNRYIDAEVSRRRAKAFSTYAKWTALTLLAFGGTAALIMLAYYLFVKPNTRVVTETKIVEKPVSYKPTIIVGSDALSGETEISKTKAAAEGRIEELTMDPQSGASLFNYVIFREIPFSEDGFSQITIGMHYASEAEDSPSKQWCYMMRDYGSADLGLRIDLASKRNDNRIDHTITETQARELGTTLQLLLRAQSRCQFR